MRREEEDSNRILKRTGIWKGFKTSLKKIGCVSGKRDEE